MPQSTCEAAICDANILIDYLDAEVTIFRELIAYWGKVYVPERVLKEVQELSRKQAEQLGLTIVRAPLILPVVVGLSVPDRACLALAIQENWICLTNDKRLRQACRQKGGTVMWGLQMLFELVSAHQIPVARAELIARRIKDSNPEITEMLLEKFLAKLHLLDVEMC